MGDIIFKFSSKNESNMINMTFLHCVYYCSKCVVFRRLMD